MSKRKGARSEYKTIRLLEGEGYVCTKAGGSFGTWDIVAINGREILLVQVKTNCWPRTVEMEAMRTFICPDTCRKLIHRWDDRNGTPRIKEI